VLYELYVIEDVPVGLLVDYLLLVGLLNLGRQLRHRVCILLCGVSYLLNPL
jgi:hypothetical protein